jgi:hypothetical protein
MPHAGPAVLSSLAREIVAAGEYDRLVVTQGTPEKARDLLSGIAPAQLLSAPVADQAAA